MQIVSAQFQVRMNFSYHSSWTRTPHLAASSSVHKPLCNVHQERLPAPSHSKPGGEGSLRACYSVHARTANQVVVPSVSRDKPRGHFTKLDTQKMVPSNKDATHKEMKRSKTETDIGIEHKWGLGRKS